MFRTAVFPFLAAIVLIAVGCVGDDDGAASDDSALGDDSEDSDDASDDSQTPPDDDTEDDAPGLIEPVSPFLKTEGRWFVDGRNRVVILRGVQIIKSSAPYLTFHTEEDYDRLTDWGFNSIRLGTTWAAIEPEPGVYDDEYLAELRERLFWCRERGVWAVLDMHQDLYGEKFNGDGAPVWATQDDGIPYAPVSPWFLNYLQPAVMRAFDNFWNNKADVQDSFIAMWTHVAEQFAKEPALAGYDLMNEPFFGSTLPLPFPEISFDRLLLQPFYERLIPAMQAADANHIYFFEPIGAAGAGLPCYLEKMDITGIAFAPHNYAVIPNVFNLYYGNAEVIDMILRSFERKSAEMDVPWWVGEWALFNGRTVNGAGYMKDITGLMDEYMVGWGYWIYDKDNNVGLLDQDGNERTWIADIVSRTYPQRIRGIPLRFSFDPDGKRFEMSWRENPAASGPTVIFVPQPRHYPDGFTVVSSDEDGRWTWQWDEERNLLYVEADREAEYHTLVIEPVDLGG